MWNCPELNHREIGDWTLIHSDDLESRSRPLCELLEHSTTYLFSAGFPSRKRGTRRLFELEESRGVWFPTVQHDSLLYKEDSAGAGGDRSSGTVLAPPMLVPVLDGAGNGYSAPSVPLQVTADISTGETSSSDQGRVHSSNRLAALRSCLEERGFPPKVVELILGATRSNAHSAYQSAWVLWRSCCRLASRRC